MSCEFTGLQTQIILLALSSETLVSAQLNNSYIDFHFPFYFFSFFLGCNLIKQNVHFAFFFFNKLLKKTFLGLQ
jgi:hypothetical protein